MDYKYKWQDPVIDNIKAHINSHIIHPQHKEELDLWKNLLGVKYDSYISSNGQFKDELIDEYYSIANNVIDNFDRAYGFKTNNKYSINYETKDNLTTCLKLNNKLDEYKIASCFFRFSKVIDSSILYVVKYLLSYDSSNNNYIDIKDFLCKDDLCMKALYKCNEYITTNSNMNKNIRVITFLYQYLKEQFIYYKNKEDKKLNIINRDYKKFIYYYDAIKYLGLKLGVSHDYLSNLLGDIDISNNLNLVNKMIASLKDNCIELKRFDIDFYNTELSFLEICKFFILDEKFLPSSKDAIEIIKAYTSVKLVN